jgi:hypothetical protein
MHNSYRILAAAGILLLFGAVSAFASGQTESSKLSGTISTIQPVGNNMVSVVLLTKSGSYTVQVSRSLATAASLTTGKQVSLDGVLHQASDGTKSVDATDIQVDGKSYSTAASDQSGGPGISQDSGSGSGNQAAEHPETPEPPHPESPDAQGGHGSSGGSSHGRDR